MEQRQEFSRKTRATAFLRADGKCEQCTTPLRPGKFIYDHILPDWFGGEPTLENCQVICAACDGKKTPTDQASIAKTKRIRDKHTGAMKPKRPWPKRTFAQYGRTP